MFSNKSMAPAQRLFAKQFLAPSPSTSSFPSLSTHKIYIQIQLSLFS